jgi:hypothetical protein
MFLFKLVLALGIIVGVLVLVFRFQKQIQSGGTSTADQRPDGARATELEEFIAAYRRDKATGQVQSNPTSAQPVIASAPAMAPTATTSVKARAAFLSGAAKLAFLVLKAGLPDHHVFAHTRVSDLMEGSSVPALANLPIDLLVCSKDLGIVAAVDLNNGTQSDALLLREKEQRLRSVGIRYLRFAPGAFPKPAEVRKLIYGE